jgi:hypothetical protein
LAHSIQHDDGVLYGTELGSVTLKRVGLFLFSNSTLNTHKTERNIGQSPYLDEEEEEEDI